jgi:hypothetical protein
MLLLFLDQECDCKRDVEESDNDVEVSDSGGFDSFEGTPKAMLPYSSLFLFGPTNP